jgi:lysophospholipase L1-like esterase
MNVSRNRVRDLDNRWQKDALDLKPDVVSILIGVNDVNAIVSSNVAEPVGRFEETYKRILDRTLEALPDTLFVLMEPFILPLGHVNNRTEIWNDEILKRQQIIQNLANTYHTMHVKLQEPFTKACEKAPAKYWIWDGIHPMPAGHELMARLWLQEVRKTLTFIKRRSLLLP